MKIRRILLVLLVLLLFGAGSAYFFYFPDCNRVVQEKFQGRVWELPARVYARPLALYIGRTLTPDLFRLELDLMNYQRVENPVDLDVPGKYIHSKNAFDVFCRSFDFGDEKTAARRIKIRIEKDRVTSLTYSQKTSADDMVRLDPAMVGSFYPSSMEDRILVTLDALPSLLPQAIIGVEDKNFYTHYGVDFLSISRAVWINLKNRRITQGASTITQQLAKNFFLSREKTLRRKINELFMAMALELNYSKKDILEAYINEVYLGQDGNRAVHGFGLASVFYFGKSVRDLRAHEVALLVGLLKGPSYYNPRKYPDRATKRRNVILKMMWQQRIITESEMTDGLKTGLGILEKPIKGNSPFPYYLDLVKRQLLKEYREADLKSMGLRIFTPLDPQVQVSVEKSTAVQLRQIAQKRGLSVDSLEASAVVTATAGNEVQALIGGKHSGTRGFNRALDARRPIGSLIKPAVFVSALTRSETYTLMTKISDDPIAVSDPDGGKWTPRNFDRRYHGMINLYQALVHSYNSSTVRLGMDLGLAQVSDTLQKMGVDEKIELYPSMLLGSLEMSPFNVAQMYHTLSAGGFFTPARSIRTIFTPDGKRLQRYPLTVQQQLDPGAVFLLNKILQAVVMEGTARKLRNWLPQTLGVAGKTGTTNDLKDSWFAGFTGNRLAVVWVGRDDNRPAKLTGSQGAMQIFGRFMSRIPNQPLNLPVPENVVWEIVDRNSGLLTNEGCENAMVIPFIRGSSPDKSSICKQTRDPSSKTGKQNETSEEIPRRIFNWVKDIFK